MKVFLVLLALVFSQNIFAGNGYEEIQKLYENGAAIDLKTLKTVDAGIYVGKCFRGSVPKSAFVGFKNLAENAGPLPVDPTLIVSWGASDAPDYFEKVNVKHQVVPYLRYLATSADDSELTATLNGYEWSYNWKQSATYLVQENRWYGNVHSYCYYYQFRE